MPKARSKAGEWEQSAFADIRGGLLRSLQTSTNYTATFGVSEALTLAADHDYTCPNPTLRPIFMKGVIRTLCEN